jgi:hypothetical protein
VRYLLYRFLRRRLLALRLRFAAFDALERRCANSAAFFVEYVLPLPLLQRPDFRRRIAIRFG